jgi:signal transduction histidine kinase
VSTRGRLRSPGIEAFLALLSGVGAFAVSAVVVAAGLPRFSVIIIGVLYVLGVLAVGHFWGIAYAVPVGVAGVVALDWHYIPPTHPATVPDPENALALAAYLTAGVLLGQLGEHARRRAEASELARAALADEQAALRRVATRVAHQRSPAEVFALVTEEVARLLPTDVTSMLRYETDGTAAVIASQSESGMHAPIGTRMTMDEDSVASRVYRSGRPVRVNDFADATGPVAAFVRQIGVRSAAGSPIVVDGRLWGVMVTASSRVDAIPEGAEKRIGEFTELVATAIANAETRAELTASRARIVAASDETRRRLERDLHDGTQQRLISLALDLRNAQDYPPSDSAALRAQLGRIETGLTDVLEDLRDITHGIHPAILTQGGLRPALKGLARRSPVPVELDVRGDDRLPGEVEVAMFYAVSEAIANAAKHAQASVVHVDVAAEDSIARLLIHDDGLGGVILGKGHGSGLVGLRDRIEALGGRIDITSPSGSGTTLAIRIPARRRLAETAQSPDAIPS